MCLHFSCLYCQEKNGLHSICIYLPVFISKMIKQIKEPLGTSDFFVRFKNSLFRLLPDDPVVVGRQLGLLDFLVLQLLLEQLFERQLLLRLDLDCVDVEHVRVERLRLFSRPLRGRDRLVVKVGVEVVGLLDVKVVFEFLQFLFCKRLFAAAVERLEFVHRPERLVERLEVALHRLLRPNRHVFEARFLWRRLCAESCAVRNSEL